MIGNWTTPMDTPQNEAGTSPANTLIRDESEAEVQITYQNYKEIVSRLKDHRERFLQALSEDRDESDSEGNPSDSSTGVSKTYLCSEHGAAVPRGSFEMHYSWLRGEREWWPDEVGALVCEVGRDPSGRGQPTRLFGLTPWGSAFIELLYENEVLDPGASVADLRQAVRAQSDRITALTARIEELEAENGDLAEQLSQYQEKTDERITQIIDILEER